MDLEYLLLIIFFGACLKVSGFNFFKNSDDNFAKLKKQRETINDYLEGPINRWCL